MVVPFNRTEKSVRGAPSVWSVQDLPKTAHTYSQ